MEQYLNVLFTIIFILFNIYAILLLSSKVSRIEHKFKFPIYIGIILFISLSFSACAGNMEPSKTQALEETTSSKGQTSLKKQTALKKQATSNYADSQVLQISKTKLEKKQMKVHFIDVGQADCIFIESNGHYMLVDTGNRGDAAKLVNYLKSNNVESLDYVIGTHPHEDHIGSLDVIINTFKINTLILPQKSHTSKNFEDVMTAIENKGLKVTAPKVGTTYSIGNGTFTIIAPNSTYGNDLNNWSVGIKLTNGAHSFIMCGDAEQKGEEDISNNKISLSADVYKVNHHGSETGTSDEFLKAISPKYAVISVGKENIYKHPSEETLQKLTDFGVQIFRTDEQGTIIATSDGTTIDWNINGNEVPIPVDSLLKKNIKQEAKIEKKQSAITGGENVEIIVHITETGSKYHNSDCKFLSQSDYTISLEEAKKKGFEPCSRCNPTT